MSDPPHRGLNKPGFFRGGRVISAGAETVISPGAETVVGGAISAGAETVAKQRATPPRRKIFIFENSTQIVTALLQRKPTKNN